MIILFERVCDKGLCVYYHYVSPPRLLSPSLETTVDNSPDLLKSSSKKQPFFAVDPTTDQKWPFRFVEFFWPEPACGNIASQPIATVVATIESLQYFNFFKSFSQ